MAPRKPAKGARPGKARAAAAKDYRLPDRLPAGLELVDLRQTCWRLGESIGVGGFGEIYLATPKSSAATTVPHHVVKIEPHTNGPLFCEVHCYMRLCVAGAVQAWMRERRLSRLGMPEFAGNGSVEYAGNKYRFLVMERFGSDLQRLLQKNGGVFPIETVLRVAIQVIDTLEYIHSKGYVHADIKAQNLLLGFRKGLENQVYLVDFGLACRYLSATDGVHVTYAPDARKAHNGTIEFTSRDAHVGANSRRGDLEILGYNLLQWASGSGSGGGGVGGGGLPWMHELSSPNRVAALKCRYMQDTEQLVTACFSSAARQSIGTEIEAIGEYLRCVASLQFDENPNYDHLRSLLHAPLTARGRSAKYLQTAPLLFTGTAESNLPPASRGTKKAAVVARSGSGAVKKRRRDVSPAVHSDRQSPGQENARAVAPPSAGRRIKGRRPLASVTDNTATLPLPPIDLEEVKVPHLPLRSDGRLSDFDFANYDRALNGLRRSGSGRSSAATTPSKDSPSHSPPAGLACLGADVGDGLAGLGRLNAAMKEVLAKSMASRAARARKTGVGSTQKRPRAKKRTTPKNSPVKASDEGCAPPTQAMLDVMSRIKMRRLSNARHKRRTKSADRSTGAPACFSPVHDQSFLSTDESFYTPPTSRPRHQRLHSGPQRRHRSGCLYDTP